MDWRCGSSGKIELKREDLLWPTVTGFSVHGCLDALLWAQGWAEHHGGRCSGVHITGARKQRGRQQDGALRGTQFLAPPPMTLCPISGLIHE
jgi:hypothetical protein